jgi:hypothetical protein
MTTSSHTFAGRTAYSLYLVANPSDSPSTNTTTITFQLYIHPPSPAGGAYDLSNSSSYSINIGGGTAFTGNYSYDFRTSTANKVLRNGTKTFSHSEYDGTLAVNASATSAAASPLGTATIGSFGITGIGTFNHSPYQPSFSNIDRSPLSSAYLGYNGVGTVSGYAGGLDSINYVFQFATRYDWEVNSTWTNGNCGSNPGLDPYSAYLFGLYAWNYYSSSYTTTAGWYWGQPYAPNWTSYSRSSSSAGQIDLAWDTPSNDYYGYGSVQYYHVYRDGGWIAQVSGNSYSDTGLSRGSTHTYQVYCLGSSFWSPVSATTSSIMAPGVPSAPGTPTISSVSGTNVTIKSSRTSSDYGNAISEYRLQLSTDGGTTWKGWDNTAKAFTATDTYNVIDASGNFSYTSLTPGLTYVWRSFAVNSIGTGDVSATSASQLISASGKVWNGSAWVVATSPKIWNGTSWINPVSTKVWNGTAWTNVV